MATTTLPTSQQLNWNNDALLIQDVVVTGNIYTSGSTLMSVPTVAAGSTLTLTSANAGQTILLNTAAGSTVTLPAATGSGVAFRFEVSVLATSNSHVVQVASAADWMNGIILEMNTSTNAVTGWVTADTGTSTTESDTITLNRTTTGSVKKGESFSVRDIATNIWLVEGVIAQSGSAATPFSAAV